MSARGPTPQDIQRLEELELVLRRLREAAAGQAIVVEGQNDAAALEALGVGGTHLLINRGEALEVVVDRLAAVAEANQWSLILLTDWDRTGGRLFKRLHQGLVGRVPVDATYRRRLAVVCHSRTVEDIPAELTALRQRCGVS